ncbi:MAG: hypothetical protein ACOYOK_02930 [Pseudobdellovibrionaceae bacterium]
MKMIVIALAFIGSTALASAKGYDLKIDFSLNGKHISSPRLIVKAGEVASISQTTANQEGFFIDVTANESAVQSHKGILMKFVVGVIEKNGQRTIKAKPQILAKENEPAQITVGENNKDEVALSVLVHRKSL